MLACFLGVAMQTALEFYEIVAGWVGWPPLVIVIVAAGTYLLKISHVRYKAARETIETLKEKNTWLDLKLQNAIASSPDALARALEARVRQLTDELERMVADREATDQEITRKREELAAAQARRDELADLFDELRRLLVQDGLLCPECGSPLETREHHYESVEWKGREIDVVREVAAYGCGLLMVDGRVEQPCRSESRY